MLIKNGVVVLENSQEQMDIRIENGIIQQMAGQITPFPNEEVLDVTSCLVMPGGIDAHTHFDMPAGEDLKTSDDFYTGTLAAIVGGTTSIIDFSEPDINGPLSEGLKQWHDKADGKSFCDYGFHMTVPRFDENIPSQLSSMIENGITSFKSYTAYREELGVTDKELYRIMQCVKDIGGVLCVHCENGDILECRQEYLKKQDAKDLRNHPLSRPNIVEKEAVSRVVDMAELTGVEIYIVHVSTKEAMEVIEQAKKRGVHVYAETCPHYLFFNDSKYELPGFEAAKYMMSPPLRSEEDCCVLRGMLRNGIIDTVCTDHCSFNFVGQKDRGIEDFTKVPNGIPSVEHRMELMLELGEQEDIPLWHIAQLTATNPAKIFGLYPKKGVLQVGSDADIVIVKPEKSHIISKETQCQKVDYTPYEGITVRKKIQHVLLKGELIVHNEVLEKPHPKGEFLFRNS